MIISEHQTQDRLKYLSHEKFRFILNCLNRLPSWEVCGEVIGGEPITYEEYLFVVSKVKGGGFLNTY